MPQLRLGDALYDALKHYEERVAALEAATAVRLAQFEHELAELRKMLTKLTKGRR
jgi:hypothetical protein